MNDIELIYDKVKDKYNLLLTNAFALDEGFEWDVPIIYGKSPSGKFWLYADEDVPDPHGLEFVFSVEYEKRTLFRKRLVKCHTHWHPQSIEDALDDVDKFMTGELDFSNKPLAITSRFRLICTLFRFGSR